MARKQLGILAILGLFAASLALTAIAPPAAANIPGTLFVGEGRVAWFNIFGITSGAVDGGPLYGSTMFCAPCSVAFTVTTSQYVVAGGGTIGPVPPGFTYTLEPFYGVINMQDIGPYDTVLEIQGAAGTFGTR
ncbi:MAG: hypothetical protein ACYDCK_06100 [Thermoplasmatota archaeon]